MVEELASARCCVCKEGLEKEQIVLTNPCSHFLCCQCSGKLYRIWRDEGKEKKKCPCCRVLLLQNLFTKPYIVNMSSHSKTSLFVWVPIVVYLKRDYKNDLLSALSKNELTEAFKCSFMLNSPPTDAQSLLCAEWKEYYNSRITTLKCCSCKASFPHDQLFMSSCGHFSCTICSSFLLNKPRNSPMKCIECQEIIETGINELIFMKPQ